MGDAVVTLAICAQVAWPLSNRTITERLKSAPSQSLSVGDENRQARMGQNIAGNATQDHFADPAVAVAAHDQEIRPQFRGAGNDSAADRFVVRLHHLDTGMDTVPCEVVG